MTCDGTETICISLTDEAEAQATGASNAGGSFSGQGYQPSDGGGLDWHFPAGRFRSGRLEVDVYGLVVSNADEGSGGKVSIFDTCAENGEQDWFGLQKMTWDYHDGHNFRYAIDDDGLADNWDNVVLTASDYSGFYSAADWTSDQSHHFIAEWDADHLWLGIDDYSANSWGNGDTFDAPAYFTLAARCTHYSAQQAPAYFTNLRMWLDSEAEETPPEDTGSGGGGDTGTAPVDTGTPDPVDTGTPDDTPSACVGTPHLELGDGNAETAVMTVTFPHCEGGAAFQRTSVALGPDATSGVTVDYRDGAFWIGAKSCTPGEDTTIAGPKGTLDCTHATAMSDGIRISLGLALIPDVSLDGALGIYASATDGETEIAWTQLGTWTAPTESDVGGCGCASARGGLGLGLLAGVAGLARRRR